MKKKLTCALLLALCLVMVMGTTAFATPATLKNFEIISKDVPAVSPIFDSELFGSITPLGIYKAMVIGNGVNVRSGPGTEYPSYGHMNWGDIVYVHRYGQGADGAWAYVLCGAPHTGLYAYIHTDYIMEVDE